MKKSFLLVILMAILMPWVAVQAEELIVNDGTSTSSYAPVYGLYGDYGCRSQFVIPADSLTNMVNGTISGMTFYSSSPTQSLTGVWEVYMKEVDVTSASSTFIERTDATLVWTGSPTVVNNEFVIELDNSYAYGSGNLMIEFVEGRDGVTYKGESLYFVLCFIVFYTFNQNFNTLMYLLYNKRQVMKVEPGG